jgi:hypothetical protein
VVAVMNLNTQRPASFVGPRRVFTFPRVESAGVEVGLVSCKPHRQPTLFANPDLRSWVGKSRQAGECGLSSAPQARCLPTPF